MESSPGTRSSCTKLCFLHLLLFTEDLLCLTISTYSKLEPNTSTSHHSSITPSHHLEYYCHIRSVTAREQKIKFNFCGFLLFFILTWVFHPCWKSWTGAPNFSQRMKLYVNVGIVNTLVLSPPPNLPFFRAFLCI